MFWLASSDKSASALSNSLLFSLTLSTLSLCSLPNLQRSWAAKPCLKTVWYLHLIAFQNLRGRAFVGGLFGSPSSVWRVAVGSALGLAHRKAFAFCYHERSSQVRSCPEAGRKSPAVCSPAAWFRSSICLR